MPLLNVELIDKLNEEIEGVLTYADNIAALINDYIEQQAGEAQAYIDEQGEILSEKISEKGNEIRDKIVDIMSAQYQSALEKIQPIMPLVNALQGGININNVVSVVTDILKVLIAPYQPIIEFTTTVIPKVLELSANLQKLATYQPPLNLPQGVTPPTLNIKINPITAADITGG